MVQKKCQEETTNSENPVQDGNKPKGEKFSVKNYKANGEINIQKEQMTPKTGKTSGRSKVTSSIVTTLNFEINSLCRKKKQSQSHKNAEPFRAVRPRAATRFEFGSGSPGDKHVCRCTENSLCSKEADGSMRVGQPAYIKSLDFVPLEN